MKLTKNRTGWLMPAALILFLLAMLLIPFATELTYAGRNESPSHVLTYTTNKLTWDSATDISPSGAAELHLFSTSYQNVQSENSDQVVAPGTEGKNIVRLKNDAGNSITYVAVMYRTKDESTLPVEPVLSDCESFTDTETYPLPDGVTEEQVVRAVTGTVAAGELQDFDITWLWQYYENEERDVVDTDLGNRAAWYEPDDVTAGLYIVVTDDPGPGPDPTEPEDPDDPDDPDEPSEPVDPDDPGDPSDPGDPVDPEDPGESVEPDDPYTSPDAPDTGDTSNITLYLVLMGISGVLLLLLLLERRKETP